MTDRPIIFSAPMILALLDGRKTQTRRVMRGVRQDNHVVLRKASKRRMGITTHVLELERTGRLPYSPGDRLWVRETWENSTGGPRDISFRATVHDDCDWSPEEIATLRWRPSIHMPRWASRLTLVVTGVKVERLQEISREDAIAEGCESPLIGTEAPAPAHGVYLADERTSFAQLWNRLHGEGAWRTNPWIVAVSFVTHMRNIDHDMLIRLTHTIPSASI